MANLLCLDVDYCFIVFNYPLQQLAYQQLNWYPDNVQLIVFDIFSYKKEVKSRAPVSSQCRDFQQLCGETAFAAASNVDKLK
jgi:hypothetical protein